jgi:molybdopterin synthase catalytic subunit
MGNDLIQLRGDAIDIAAAIGLVTDPQAGGIAVFLGTTRAESNGSARQLTALDYEAYSEMAVPQMHELARTARDRWPIIRLAMLHRTGRVPLGEPSVLIAVAAPHRADAFDACRFLINTLKADVAIWKKEVWNDGTGTWVEPGKI